MRFDQRTLTILSLCVGLPLFFLLFGPTQPPMMATFGVFSHAVLWSLDCAFGAQLLGIQPAVTWSLVGAFIGACLGFWTVAPAVGKRQMRRAVGAIPLTLIACLLVGDVLYSMATAPAPPNIRPLAGPLSLKAEEQKKADADAEQKKRDSDPNNVKAPGLYTPPTEDTLSPSVEGAGPIPETTQPVLPDTAGTTANTTGANGTEATTSAGTTGSAPPITNDPYARLRGGH